MNEFPKFVRPQFQWHHLPIHDSSKPLHDPRNFYPNFQFPTRRAFDGGRFHIGKATRDDLVKPSARFARDVHRKTVRRKSMADLHADAGHFFVRAEEHTGVLGRHGAQPVRLAQVQRQDALQAADVVANADRGSRAAEVEQRIADDLPRPVVRELAASLGEHKVRAEGRQSRAFGGGFGGLRLAAPAGVDGLVLEEEEDVLVGRG